MTTVSFDLDEALRRLHGDLNHALSVQSLPLARERLTVARFLAKNCELLEVKRLAARAAAVSRFLEINHV